MKRIIINKSKFNGKRFAAAAVAGLSAAAVVITAVLSGAIEAEAADTLLGIEKLRSRYKESGSEYTVLEIVPDRAAAEIGYLFDGYEPILCEWDEEEMMWKSWQNALCELPNYDRRRDFIEGKKEELRAYYAEQGLTKNFPVEAVEEVYEEGEEKAEGFQKIVSDGIKMTGWFEKNGSGVGSDRYQISFRYAGKNNDDYPRYEDILYYTVSSATPIDQNLADGIENDRFIYVKNDGVYVCIGTWEEVRDEAVLSVYDHSKEDEDEEDEDKDKDDVNPDDENGDDEETGDDSGNDETGDDGGNGDEETGDDSGSDDDNDNSSETGDDNGDSGTGNAGDSGEGSDSDEGSGSNETDNDTGNTGDNGDDSGNDGGSSNTGDNENGSVNSQDTAKAIGTVITDLRQGKWFRLVANDDAPSGSNDGKKSEDTPDVDNGTNPDDNSGADDQPGSGDSSSSEDKTDSDDNTNTDDKIGSEDDADTDDNIDSDDEQDSDDDTDPDDEQDVNDGVSDEDEPDEDEPAADDPNDEEDKESVKKALAQEASEYYLVAFDKIDNFDDYSNDECIYLVEEIVLSENGEYAFVECDSTDTAQKSQEYTFPGKEIWCKNTFKSNEWFKKYVLNMDKKDYEDFRIKVLTFTPQELNEMEEIPNFDFLYLNSGLRATAVRKGDESGDSGDVSGNDSGDESGSGDNSSRRRNNRGSQNDSGDDSETGNTDDSGSGSDNEDNAAGNDDSNEDGNTGNDGNNENGNTDDSGAGSNNEDDNTSDSGNNDSSESGSADDGGTGNSNEDNSGISNIAKTELLTADSSQNKWLKLVAGDHVEEDDDINNASGLANGEGSENTDGLANGEGSENTGGLTNDDSLENTDGLTNGEGAENAGGLANGDGSEGADSSANTDGSEDSDSSANVDNYEEDTNNSGNPSANKGSSPRADSVSGNDTAEPETEAVTYTADNDLSADLLKFFFDKTIAGAMPCLVDGAILYAKDDSGSIIVNDKVENTNIFRLSAMLCQDNLSEWYESHRNNYTGMSVTQLMKGIVEDADKNFVTEQVYCRFGSDSIVNDQFYEATIYKEGKEIEPGFQCVLDEINLENLYRESDTSGNYKPLSTSISQAKAVRHILNYRDRRKVETKKHIRVLEIQPALADQSELTLEQLQAWAPGVESADITVMTTAEFVGKIEKLNETYDLIYLGTSKDHLNMRYWTNSSYYGKPDSGHVAAGTVFNDSDMDGLIYYNIGDLRVITLPMSGLLTSEYRNGNRNDWTYFYNYVRYGGNDISKEKMNALISFLDGSYPVIVADDFLEQPATVYDDTEYAGCRVNLSEGEYTRKDLTALGVKTKAISSIKVKDGYVMTVFDADNFEGNSATFSRNESNFANTRDQGNWNNKVVSLIIEREEDATPNRRIDGDHIDNCTYLYEFVKKAMDEKYVNFYAWGDIGNDSELFKFYLNRPKVSLTDTVVNGMTDEGSDIYYIDSDINGRYNLQYRFKIQNEGAASYSTRYRCKLYIDVNSDGKFSAQEEIEDITLTQGGNTVSSEDLYADREYVLSRQVPMGYKGLLPWKVEITQADNPNIYTSMSGYTKLKGMDKEILKICQINKNGADVIDLNYEVNTKGRHFNTLIYGGYYDGVYYPGISDEFELEITTMDVNTFQNRYYANNEYLKDFNMLILGFSDMYGDFAGDAENGPMGAIVDFINSGKSVLLGHDTTSFFNSPDLGQGDQAMKGYPWRNNTQLHDIWWYNEPQGWWYTRNASTLNKYVRPLVGMDRYGILDSDILQRGDILRQGSGDYDTVLNSGKDVAYKPKSGKTETVPEVHGYTYQLISAKDQKVLIDQGTSSKYQYTKWNMMSSGYDKAPDIVFENKYTNIRYDAAWFWDDVKEDDAARYGELEKVNNGEVNGIHATQVNKGQITEYPYKLKEEFEVAITHGQYYELDYTADDDGDGQSDLVVWYCLGERSSNDSNKRTTIYSQSPNDVRNNYYIYNKGNITYTGMGHARSKWENAEWYTFEEAKLFINTMIASYQAGIKDPMISVLKKGVSEAEEMKLLYRYYDKSNDFSLNDEMAADEYEKLYFTVQDINFIKGTRKIESHVYYQDDNGGEVINVDGDDIRVNRLADNMYNAKDGSAVDANNLASGGIYYIQVPRTIMKKCEEGLDLYFEAQSTITTNTTKVNVYTTEKVYAKLQVLQAYLFNLE